MNNEIFNLLDRLANVLKHETRGAGVKLGIQPIQQEALYYLSNCNKYSDSPIAVAEFLGLTKGTVSQTLKVLEGKGLIYRVKDDNDKRVIHLKVSPAGQDFLERTTPPEKFLLALKALPQAQQLDIHNGLKSLLFEYQTQTNRKAFGICKYCKFNQKNGSDYFCGLTKEPLNGADTERICREFATV